MLHRQIHANLALVRRVRGSSRDFARASCRRKDCVSEDHRPPTSPARTTNLALPWAPESSGYTRSFLLRAAREAAPSSLAQRLCGTPLRLKGDTRVVSTASCAPWKSGRPSATTSNRRASARSGGNRSKSRTSTFVDTRAPASRQTRAAALSRAYPRRPSTPACAQAARWWPLGSSGRPHRQKREEGGKGSQRRRRSSMRNRDESSLDKRDVGKHKNGTPANGPPCDLKSACSVSESLGLTVPSMRTPWTGSVAERCRGGECQVPCRRLAPDQDEHQLPTLPKKVHGTQPMPGILQKRGPRPCGRKVAACEGRPQCERRLSGASGGSSPDSLPSSPRKRVWRATPRCGAPGRPNSEANWPDPSKCLLGQPREGG